MIWRKRYPPHLEEELTFGREALLFIWEVVKVVVISLAIIIPVRYYLIKPFYVKGASMEPTFQDHEYLIIDELSYRLGPPTRGDVVVFRYPNEPSQFFIKRLIGMPGERVVITDSHVRVYNAEQPDGIILQEMYLPAGTATPGNIDITLGPDEYYVMGDNRPSSLDSRAFGAVKGNLLIGRVLLRGWPPSKAGFLPNDITYNF